ncbi:tetratricopeptide repeat protein [Shimwellia pseudoproteus]|uniref:tetratricopeptide repeat protein n=1 Tax=Shimwellia pseudoproteus TaxID=570012 RepID=UPI0018ECAEA5|nr:tetratricopeptide repeat protein [Shimwellia pseudoproteus]
MKSLLLALCLLPLMVNADEIDSPWLKQAQAGDRRAQYYLADTWYSADDMQQASFWAQKSAAQGDADALALLAQITLNSPDANSYLHARQQAEQAVKAGSPRGLVVLARILVNTRAGKTDYPRAISLLEQAAKNDENDSAVDAQMLLGLIYANGIGVAEDDQQATQWFKHSSMLSRTGYAEYWAGMLFSQGEHGFITPNKQKALQWLNLSCSEGFDTGCEAFDQLSGH